MKHTPFPGYENHYMSQLRGNSDALNAAKKAQSEAMNYFVAPEGMKIEDKIIPGGDGQDMGIRIFTPAGLEGPAPVVLDIHGGAWMFGNLDIDSARCAAIATRVPCIVVTVDYRLSATPEVCFPGPMLDCVAAYQWIIDHKDEIGADGQVGIHGSSCGGNLAGGMALYIRDKKMQQPALVCMNCPCCTTDFQETFAYHQNFELRMGPDVKAIGAENAYLNGYDGTTPSYYAFPGFCHDVGLLGPHMILVGEYDTLRDDGLNYALRLMKAGVPTEIFSGARVCHCWTCAPNKYTDLTHDVIAMAFQREFGLLAGEVKAVVVEQ